MKFKSDNKYLEQFLPILAACYYLVELNKEIRDLLKTTRTEFHIKDFLPIIFFTIVIIIYLFRNILVKNSSERFFFITKLQLGIYEITKKDFKRACVLGGMFSALIGSLIIVNSYITHYPNSLGYDNSNPNPFRLRTVAFILLFHICLGIVLGFICGNAAWPKIVHSNIQKKDFLSKFIIFITAFVCIVFFRQLMTKDAMVRANSYMESDGSFGGGLFGEPDFETLATGVTGGVAFLILINNLLKALKGNLLIKKPISLNREMLKIVTRCGFLGFFSWISVFFLYRLLTSLIIIHQGDFIYAKWIFVFDFPHPERYLPVMLLCFLYVFIFLLSIRFFSIHKSNVNIQQPHLSK